MLRSHVVGATLVSLLILITVTNGGVLPDHCTGISFYSLPPDEQRRCLVAAMQPLRRQVDSAPTGIHRTLPAASTDDMRTPTYHHVAEATHADNHLARLEQQARLLIDELNRLKSVQKTSGNPTTELDISGRWPFVTTYDADGRHSPVTGIRNEEPFDKLIPMNRGEENIVNREDQRLLPGSSYDRYKPKYNHGEGVKSPEDTDSLYWQNFISELARLNQSVAGSMTSGRIPFGMENGHASKKVITLEGQEKLGDGQWNKLGNQPRMPISALKTLSDLYGLSIDKPFPISSIKGPGDYDRGTIEPKPTIDGQMGFGYGQWNAVDNQSKKQGDISTMKLDIAENGKNIPIPSKKGSYTGTFETRLTTLNQAPDNKTAVQNTNPQPKLENRKATMSDSAETDEASNSLARRDTSHSDTDTIFTNMAAGSMTGNQVTVHDLAARSMVAGLEIVLTDMKAKSMKCDTDTNLNKFAADSMTSGKDTHLTNMSADTMINRVKTQLYNLEAGKFTAGERTSLTDLAAEQMTLESGASARNLEAQTLITDAGNNRETDDTSVYTTGNHVTQNRLLIGDNSLLGATEVENTSKNVNGTELRVDTKKGTAGAANVGDAANNGIAIIESGTTSENFVIDLLPGKLGGVATTNRSIIATATHGDGVLRNVEYTEEKINETARETIQEQKVGKGEIKERDPYFEVGYENAGSTITKTGDTATNAGIIVTADTGKVGMATIQGQGTASSNNDTGYPNFQTTDTKLRFPELTDPVSENEYVLGSNLGMKIPDNVASNVIKEATSIATTITGTEKEAANPGYAASNTTTEATSNIGTDLGTKNPGYVTSDTTTEAITIATTITGTEVETSDSGYVASNTTTEETTIATTMGAKNIGYVASNTATETTPIETIITVTEEETINTEYVASNAGTEATTITGTEVVTTDPGYIASNSGTGETTIATKITGTEMGATNDADDTLYTNTGNVVAPTEPDDVKEPSPGVTMASNTRNVTGGEVSVETSAGEIASDKSPTVVAAFSESPTVDAATHESPTAAAAPVKLSAGASASVKSLVGGSASVESSNSNSSKLRSLINVNEKGATNLVNPDASEGTTTVRTVTATTQKSVDNNVNTATSTSAGQRVEDVASTDEPILEVEKIGAMQRMIDKKVADRLSRAVSEDTQDNLDERAGNLDEKADKLGGDDTIEGINLNEEADKLDKDDIIEGINLDEKADNLDEDADNLHEDTDDLDEDTDDLDEDTDKKDEAYDANDKLDENRPTENEIGDEADKLDEDAEDLDDGADDKDEGTDDEDEVDDLDGDGDDSDEEADNGDDKDEEEEAADRDKETDTIGNVKYTSDEKETYILNEKPERAKEKSNSLNAKASESLSHEIVTVDERVELLANHKNKIKKSVDSMPYCSSSSKECRLSVTGVDSDSREVPYWHRYAHLLPFIHYKGEHKPKEYQEFDGDYDYYKR